MYLEISLNWLFNNGLVAAIITSLIALIVAVYTIIVVYTAVTMSNR